MWVITTKNDTFSKKCKFYLKPVWENKTPCKVSKWRYLPRDDRVLTKKALGTRSCLEKHVHVLGSGDIRNVFRILRTSSENFGLCRIVFGNPGTLRIKISRLWPRKSWQVYKGHAWVPLACESSRLSFARVMRGDWSREAAEVKGPSPRLSTVVRHYLIFCHQLYSFEKTLIIFLLAGKKLPLYLWAFHPEELQEKRPQSQAGSSLSYSTLPLVHSSTNSVNHSLKSCLHPQKASLPSVLSASVCTCRHAELPDRERENKS